MDEEALRSIEALSQGGRLNEALSQAEKLVASSPDRVESRLVLAELYRRLWRPRDAVDTLAHALELDRNGGRLVHVHRELAATFAELRLWSEARTHLDRALALSPGDRSSALAKAVVLSQSGAHEKALAIYERAATLAPEDPVLWFRSGELMESLDRFDEAERAYRRALALEPNLQGARFRLGKLLLEAGRTRPAERELSRAVRLAPEHAESRLALAKALDALGRSAKARHHFETAVALDPDLAPAFLAFGNFAAREGKREEARTLLTTFRELESLERRTAELFAAVDFDPSEFEPKEALVSLLLEHERYPLAVRMAQRFLLTDGTDERHYLLAASAFEAWGKRLEARRVLVAAREQFPDSEALRRKLDALPPNDAGDTR